MIEFLDDKIVGAIMDSSIDWELYSNNEQGVKGFDKKGLCDFLWKEVKEILNDS